MAQGKVGVFAEQTGNGATKEIERGEKLGSAFFDAIIVNDTLEVAYEKLKDVVATRISNELVV